MFIVAALVAFLWLQVTEVATTYPQFQVDKVLITNRTNKRTSRVFSVLRNNP